MPYSQIITSLPSENEGRGSEFEAHLLNQPNTWMVPSIEIHCSTEIAKWKTAFRCCKGQEWKASISSELPLSSRQCHHFLSVITVTTTRKEWTPKTWFVREFYALLQMLMFILQWQPVQNTLVQQFKFGNFTLYESGSIFILLPDFNEKRKIAQTLP